MIFCLKIDIFSVQKVLIYCTFNKSHLNSFILLVSQHVVNFRYVANFRFLTLSDHLNHCVSVCPPDPSTVEPQLSEHHGRHTIRSDNRGVRIDEGNRNLLSVGYRVGDN